MNIAIVGATGNVGRKLLEVIEKLNFEFSELYLIASDKSVGKKITFKGKTYSIVGLNDFDFSKVKIAFFSAGSAIAEKWAPIAAKKTIVIDNSKHFRMDKDIPLVVPEVNADILKNYKNKNIIANANIIIDERQRLFDELTAMPGLKVFPSQANFILIKVDDAKSVFEFLKANRILVKSFAMNPKLSNCIRVTVGNPSENNEFLGK